MVFLLGRFDGVRQDKNDSKFVIIRLVVIVGKDGYRR